MDEFGRHTFTAEVLLQEPKVILIADISILINVHSTKTLFYCSFLGSKIYEAQGVFDSLFKFRKVHDPLGSLLVKLLPMQPLDSNFSEMLLHAEVYQLIVLNNAVVIVVIPMLDSTVPEDIFDEIMNFLLILMQDLHQKLSNLFLLKLLIVVFIELDQLDVDYFSYLQSQLIRRELEFLALHRFLLQSYKTPFLVCCGSRTHFLRSKYNRIQIIETNKLI